MNQVDTGETKQPACEQSVEMSWSQRQGKSRFCAQTSSFVGLLASVASVSSD